MAMFSPQNFGLSAASGDLGLGDALQQQTEAEVIERRKKLLAAANQQPAAYGALGLGTGLNTGLGNGGYAAQALLGQ